MWKAFEAMNIEAAVPLVHPQLEWETRWPGMEGAYRGVDGLRSYLAALVEALDLDPPRLIDSYEIDASRVLLHYRISARGAGSGVDVAMEFWDIWTVREGRLFRRQVFHDREAALTASDHDR
jgi:ketosteroid isomerase-like protein